MKYIELLRRADEHFNSVAAEQPQTLQCRLGCTACCYGLFEIGAADVPLIAEGLSALPETVRSAMVERAERTLQETDHPILREVTAREKEEFFRRAESVPCPALGDGGECLIYEYRPLVCRTFGLPLRDGREFLGEECELNFTAALRSEKEVAAWDLQWEDELGVEDQYTVAEAIVLTNRMRR